MIEKAQKEDLKEILELQYWAYQSEAKLFGDIIGSVRGYEENGTVYIGKLMVHPKMQKQGIGTQLLLAMENEFLNSRYELFTVQKVLAT